MQTFQEYINKSTVVEKLMDHQLTDLFKDGILDQIDEIQQMDFDWIKDTLENVKNSIEEITEEINLKSFDVVTDEVPIEYTCRGDDYAKVWRPDSSENFPLISFAHGLQDGGENIKFYDPMLTDLASHGYVIIGLKAAKSTYCHDEYKDQLTTIEWAKNDAEYSQKIDWTKQVGLLGHSMGGESTHRAAAEVDAVKNLNIGAAVAISPVYRDEKILVPFFFGTGTEDTVIKPAKVEKAYDELDTSLSGAYANIIGADHHEVTYGPNRFAPYTASFFNCHLLGTKYDCDNIYGDTKENPCSLCNCSAVPMEQCEFRGPPINPPLI